MFPPAQYIATNTSGGVSPGLQVSGRVILSGFSMSNNDGSNVGTVDVIDGTTISGVQLFRVQLSPKESTREWFGKNGIALEQGLFVRRISGDVNVTLFYLPETWVDEADAFAYPDRVG